MNTYNEIKKILLSERDLDITTINNYLNIDYKSTINIIFDVFYDSISSCTYPEINLILYNIESIINLQDTDKLKLILIDLNRKMRLKKESRDNYNAYTLYNHLMREI